MDRVVRYNDLSYGYDSTESLNLEPIELEVVEEIISLIEAFTARNVA